MIASSDSDFQTDYEVMKLSKQNCDEIFGVVDVEELGKEKDHLVGYMCAECRQDNDELNDGL